MKLHEKVMTGFTALLLGSTALCGASLTSGATVEAVNFHMQLATATIIFTAITLALLVNRARKAKA